MNEQQNDDFSVLVSLDEHYLPMLRTMLFSLFLNNPGRACHVYLLHSHLTERLIYQTAKYIERLGFRFTAVLVESELFQSAPVTDRYPREMYYRLMASRLLPENLGRVPYLDPDLLVINPLGPLWELDMKGRPFAAASHIRGNELATGVNKLRLDTDSEYFNSGVLMMDLKLCRRQVIPEIVFEYVDTHRDIMMLPDQDILNALYGNAIQPFDDLLWNYDARKYKYNLFRSGGKANVEWVMEHTAILHFCGRAKPWKRDYPYRFGVLYRHYMQLEKRYFGK